MAVSAASAMSLKDTSLPPSPPAPPIDGRTLFNLEALLIATKMKAEAEAQEAQNATTMKAEAEVSPEGLADKTTTDKTSPILNDLGPVALPFYCELYPHCGCDPAKDRVAMLDTPYAMLE